MDEMSVGELAEAVGIETEGKIRRRLTELGIVRGARIKCVGVSPLGDPKAYFIRGSVLALRAVDTKKITVRPI